MKTVKVVRHYDRVKRFSDAMSAIIGLVLTSPLLAIVALAVLLRLGSPVFFRQDRPGKDGRIFTLYKFRTMRAVDSGAGLISDEHRLTAFGRVLRSTSLDELPTLVNVVKGDMSVVGPRPLLVQYLARYTPVQARRHEVRPGITGLAQASGRNLLTWEQKFALDVEYVNRRGLSLDLRILAMTIVSVVMRDGISEPGRLTATEYTGAHRQESEEQ